MLAQARQILEQGTKKTVAQPDRRPVLEFAKIQDVTNNGKAGEQIRPDVHICALNSHSACLL